MGDRVSGGRLAVAALATALLAVLVPGAGTTAAPKPSIASLEAELVAAKEEELRAMFLLVKDPPRDGTAKLMLSRSLKRLDHILDALESLSLPPLVRRSVQDARHGDGSAAELLPTRFQPTREVAMKRIEKALREKYQALGALFPPPPPGGSQCADGRDNDGDQLVDARYESGCTSKKDTSERSPLTCTLASDTVGGLSQVKGSCSGTFAKIELAAPQGTTFDTKRMPAATQAELCRYSSPSRLECTMRDGAANPRHLVDVRFRVRNGSASRLRALIGDFAGRRRTWAVAPRRMTADLAITASAPEPAPLDANGQGRVSGTLVVTSLGPDDSGPVELLISADRLDSGRAAKVDSLPCAPSPTGTTCTGLRFPAGNAGVELAFAWSLPVSGAGRLVVMFELQSDAADPLPGNNRAFVDVFLVQR